MDALRNKAIGLGATEFGLSKTKDKRMYVIFRGKKVNFGLKGGSTFIDHRDEAKRDAWMKRHTAIKLKDGSPAHMSQWSPSFWSKHILWN